EQTILPKPSITLTKTADTDDDGQSDAGSVSAVGDPIDYFVTITNTGPVALDMTSILDDFLTNNSPPDSFTCPFYPAPVTDQVLDPGEAVVCTGQHLTTETDLTNGYITNLASTLADPVYNASYAALASCPVGSTTNDAGIIPSPGCPATTSTYTYPNLVDAQDAVSVFVDLPFVPPVINDLPLTGWDHPFPFEAVGTTLALTAIATFLITTRRRIAVT
ncbi:MAG: hypothetical protein LBH13_02365, partial [Cellulomonadaceae bacterium]|nr:hypothetical protein [Cellulomonadaceae bacterium]